MIIIIIYYRHHYVLTKKSTCFNLIDTTSTPVPAATNDDYWIKKSLFFPLKKDQIFFNFVEKLVASVSQKGVLLLSATDSNVSISNSCSRGHLNIGGGRKNQNFHISVVVWRITFIHDDDDDSNRFHCRNLNSSLHYKNLGKTISHTKGCWWSTDWKRGTCNHSVWKLLVWINTVGSMDTLKRL